MLTDYTTSLMATAIFALLTSCIVSVIPQRTPPQAAVCDGQDVLTVCGLQYGFVQLTLA